MSSLISISFSPRILYLDPEITGFSPFLSSTSYILYILSLMKRVKSKWVFSIIVAPPRVTMVDLTTLTVLNGDMVTTEGSIIAMALLGDMAITVNLTIAAYPVGAEDVAIAADGRNKLPPNQRNN